MEPSKSVGAHYLLTQNPEYCGWLKKQNDGLFKKTFSKKYGIINNNIFYVFNDNTSSVATLAFDTREVSVLHSTQHQNRWSFTIASDNQSDKRPVSFIVGSQRELQEWIDNFNKDEHYIKFTDLKRGSPDGEQKVDKAIESELSPCKNKEVLTNDVDLKPRPSQLRQLPVLPKKSNEPVLDNNNTRYGQCPFRQVPELPPDDTIVRRKASILKYEVINDNVTNDSYTLMSPASCMEKSVYMVPPLEDMYENMILPSSVYQWNLDRERADALLKSVNKSGLYLFRKSNNGTQVLSAYLNEKCRHYIIFRDNDMLYLRNDQPRFKSFHDLVFYYLRNDLPTCGFRLIEPYR